MQSCFVKITKYFTPPLPKIISDLVGDFIVLEAAHKQAFPNKRFFSYRWILNRLLKKYKLFSWVKYVKKLKNTSSCKRYTKMFDTIMSSDMLVPIQDTVPVIEKPLGRRQDGDFQSLYPESFGSNLSGSVVRRQTEGGSCPTRCGLPGNPCLLEARVDSTNSTLQKLFASYILKESLRG